MNVPSKCSYQSTCVTRTVQSIDKDKQKNAGVRRYNIVSKRVTSTCCDASSSCFPPTTGDITPSNCSSDGQYITTCDYTVNSSGGTSFQWYYILQSNPPQPFIDGPNISGSQTPTLRMSATDQVDTCLISNIYCIVTNSCGSVQISLDQVVGGCPIVQ
jgi:Flp pilus assembly protein TadG